MYMHRYMHRHMHRHMHMHMHMRNAWKVILLISLVLTAAPVPAHAGRIWLFAESALLNSGSVAVKTQHVNLNTTENYVTVDCQKASGCHWSLPFAYPPDAGNSFQYKVWFHTNDTSAGNLCAWFVTESTTPDGANALFGAVTGNVVEASRTHNADPARYGTNLTTALTNTLNGTGNCTGNPSICIDTVGYIEMSLDSTTTVLNGGAGKLCEFRALQVNY